MLSIQRLKASHILPAAVLATATVFFAQSNGPQTNSSVLDANGTAHVTRVVPIPTTISPESQAALRRPDSGDTASLAERRIRTDVWQTGAGKSSRAAYPVNIESLTLAGVPVRNVTPIEASPHPESVLINLHGGGFNSDSGSFTESIPIANLTRIRVVSVLYRLAPEHPFPAAVDDAIAVYRELLKTYKPQHIGIYGTSAGAILTTEVAVRLRQLNLPLPAALGVFSGMGDFSQNADSQSLYSLRGLTGSLPVADGTAHNGIRRRHQSQRPGPLADLCRSQRHATHSLYHQHSRPAAQRHHHPPSPISLKRCRRAPRRLRSTSPRLLE